jgi:hypothetical protein
MARATRTQLPPTPPDENAQGKRGKAPRGAKRKQPSQEVTPHKRQRTSKQKSVPTPPSPDSMEDVEDEMEVDEPEESLQEEGDIDYIVVKDKAGHRIRKQRIGTHYFVARCQIDPAILDVLDEDPTFTIEEFKDEKRGFGLGLRIGLSEDKKAAILLEYLVDRARKNLNERSRKVRRAFLDLLGMQET